MILRHFRVCFFAMLGCLISCGGNTSLPKPGDCIVRMEIDWMDVPIQLTSSRLNNVLDQVKYQLYMIVKRGVSYTMQGSRGELVYFQLPEMCDKKVAVLQAAVNNSNVNESGDYFVSVSNLSFEPARDTIRVTGRFWREE